MAKIERTKDEIKSDIKSKSKVCCICKQRKFFDDFYNLKNKTDGKCYRCKKCDDLARKKWRESNLERSQRVVRNQNLKSKYSLTIEDYEAILKQQKGSCAICGVKENTSLYGLNKSLSFAVDHDHKTGKIRGLLCNRCNRALGLLKDSIVLLKQAVKYLVKAS